jgi:hypothetical protein
MSAIVARSPLLEEIEAHGEQHRIIGSEDIFLDPRQALEV